jgi:hypothetical protein
MSEGAAQQPNGDDMNDGWNARTSILISVGMFVFTVLLVLGIGALR